MGDGPGGHAAPGHALPQGGVAQRSGHWGHRAGTDGVLHIQGDKTLPGKDVIVETIENINLKQKSMETRQQTLSLLTTYITLSPLLWRNFPQTLSPNKI